MKARFRHRHDPRAGVVYVHVQPGDGRVSERFSATESEMRRFAWALLADLAPDDLPDAKGPLTERHDAICAVAGNRIRRRLYGKTGLILRHLAQGPASTAIFARLINRPTSNASALLVGLCKAGLAERCNMGGQGVAAVWSITAAGRAALLADAA